MPKYRPSFAHNQLYKQGWEEGKGLGKSEDGIKSAIKVKVKNNKGGLGHDAGSDFTFHWWDHIFNKTANAIEVVNSKNDEEVSIKKNENAKKIVPQLMYNKRPLPQYTNGKPLLYGTFVSGGTISKNDSDNSIESSDSESESEEEYSTDLLDRTFKKTGLTGHKGARHGLQLSGKLKRIQDQECNNTSSDDSKNEITASKKQVDKENDEKKKKKKNKRKLSDDEKEEVVVEKTDLKKKKKTKKTVVEDSENVNCNEKIKMKKKQKKVQSDEEEQESLIEQETEPKKKKKKKKE